MSLSCLSLLGLFIWASFLYYQQFWNLFSGLVPLLEELPGDRHGYKDVHSSVPGLMEAHREKGM
jgi:hypothetical protein